MKTTIALLTVATALTIMPQSTMAMEKFLQGLPNGSAFKKSLGHSGSGYTAFGQMFSGTWSATLCKEKFPGSSVTVGQAFGDPCCTWKQGGKPDFTVTFSANFPAQSTSACASGGGAAGGAAGGAGAGTAGAATSGGAAADTGGNGTVQPGGSAPSGGNGGGKSNSEGSSDKKSSKKGGKSSENKSSKSQSSKSTKSDKSSGNLRDNESKKSTKEDESD